MNDILIKIEEKRGYYSITYFKAKSKQEYEDDKSELGYLCIQKDEIDGYGDFISKIKLFYIECLSGKNLVFIK